MRPPVEHRGARARASAAQAAWFLAVCAAWSGLLAGFGALLLLRWDGAPPAVLAGGAPMLAVLSWTVAVAAVLTAVAARTRDPSDRRARAALRIAAPGAAAGTVAMVLVIVLLTA